MEYAKITGLNRDVSRIGLGTWSIGGFMWGGTDEQAALDTIRQALVFGINLIDSNRQLETGYRRADRDRGDCARCGDRSRWSRIHGAAGSIFWHGSITGRIAREL